MYGNFLEGIRPALIATWSLIYSDVADFKHIKVLFLIGLVDVAKRFERNTSRLN